MKRYSAEGALLLATIIWGATFVIVKLALNDSSPMLFVALRFTFAALILFHLLSKILKELIKKHFMEAY